MDLNILEILQNQPEFRSLVEKIHSGKAPSLLGFPKAARLPVLAALKAALEQPILLVTDKTDRALILERMDSRRLGRGRQGLVDFWTVFDGARSLADIDVQIRSQRVLG